MLLTFMWMGVAAGMFTIIVAAMNAQDNSVCKGYKINIKGWKDSVLFTSEAHVTALLKTATQGDIKGQKLSVFDLPKIEELLEQSAWVYNAQLYFDNRDILNVNVTERKPLARVFTNTGKSFYIDEAGKQIPLSDKISLDVPVFTGYPDKYKMNATDSSLLQNMIATASFISEDPFWGSQVSQIDINACGTDCWNMEMVPVVGNHRVELGDGSDIASKFHRLYLFYSQVLKRTGFDKYQKIDVQYNGQVVGVKGKYTRIDSLQLRKNIENMLVQSRQSNELMEENAKLAIVPYKIDTTGAEMYRRPASDYDTTEIAAVGMPDQKPETVVKEETVAVAAPATTVAPIKKLEHIVHKPVQKGPALHAATPVKHNKPEAAAEKKHETKGTPVIKHEVKKTADHEPHVKTKAPQPVKKQETKKAAPVKPVDVKKPAVKVAVTKKNETAAHTTGNTVKKNTAPKKAEVKKTTKKAN